VAKRQLEISNSYFYAKVESDMFARYWGDAYDYSSAAQELDFTGVGLSWTPLKADGFRLSALSLDFQYQSAEGSSLLKNKHKTTGTVFTDQVDTDQKEYSIKARANLLGENWKAYLSMGLSYLDLKQYYGYFSGSVSTPIDVHLATLPTSYSSVYKPNTTGTGSMTLASLGLGLARTYALTASCQFALKAESSFLAGTSDGLLKSQRTSTNTSTSNEAVLWGYDMNAAAKVSYAFGNSAVAGIEGGYRWRSMFDDKLSYGKQYGAYVKASLAFRF
jgi:hypothetical protein